MATRKQIPLIPTDSSLAIAAAKTVSFDYNFTHSGADVEIIGSGVAEISFPSSSDTVLGRASIDSITGLKTFDKDKLAMKGTSTGTNIISVANISATSYTNTLPAKDGTFTMLSDLIPSNIPMETLVGTPTYGTLNDFMNSFGSTGRKTGGVGSDAGSSKVAVSAGTGFIKATDDDNAQLIPFDWAAPADITIPADSSRYIGVEWNSGTPQVVARTTSTWDFDTEFPLVRAVNETINGAEELYVVNTPWWVTDGMTNVIQALRSFGLVRRDEYVGGLMLSGTGTRNIAVSAGNVWAALNDTAFAGLDTAVTGSVEGYWYKAGSGWQSSALTQWSKTQWNDVTQTTLQTIDNNKYCNVWIYGEMTDSTITIALLYPQAQYNTAAEAEAKSAPDNVPTHIAQLGMLLGRFIIKQNVDAPVSIQSVFTTKFGTSVVTSHANLGSLGWTSSGHTGTASTIAGFAAATGEAAEYTLSGTGTALATTIAPTFTSANISSSDATGNLFTITNTNATNYSHIKYVGTVNSFSSGVGNGSATIADLVNKFYIYDFTNTKVAMTIVPNTLLAKFYGDIETVGSIQLGGASDCTISRTGAGAISVEGVAVILSGAALGTPSSGTLTNCTGLPISGLVNSTSTALGLGSINLGHASDTTITRSAAGVIAVESVVIPSISSTNTLTNKRITPRVYSTTSASSVTPAIGTYDRYFYTALAEAITINAPSATPTTGEVLAIYLTDNGTGRAITWNATYKALGAALPTTTVAGKTLEIIATYNGTDWLTTTGQLV